MALAALDAKNHGSTPNHSTTHLEFAHLARNMLKVHSARARDALLATFSCPNKRNANDDGKPITMSRIIRTEKLYGAA
jgi:hypothetical protein